MMTTGTSENQHMNLSATCTPPASMCIVLRRPPRVTVSVRALVESEHVGGLRLKRVQGEEMINGSREAYCVIQSPFVLDSVLVSTRARLPRHLIAPQAISQIFISDHGRQITRRGPCKSGGRFRFSSAIYVSIDAIIFRGRY